MNSLRKLNAFRILLLTAATMLFVAAPLQAQSLTASEQASVESTVHSIMQQTNAPAVSIAIARGNRVIYTHAFGWAVLPQDHAWPLTGRTKTLAAHARRAQAAMAFPIGSNSKAFTATCILLLQQEGKLRLDDPIARWLPFATDARQITIRNLLTHTSGYPDAAPEPYMTARVAHPTTGARLAAHWATKPLDLAPGTRYEYSNLNYTLASLIIKKASGMSFHAFLWHNVIEPLHLKGVLDLDEPGQRNHLQVVGHERYALGPLRPDTLEAPGWYAGAGTLAMSASAMATWDLSILHRTLLSAASYKAMETSGRLKDGKLTGYGLALHVGTLPNGKRVLYHGGVVNGFVSSNLMVPKDNLAIVVLTNSADGTAGRISDSLRNLFEQLPTASPKATPPSNATPALPARHTMTAPEAEIARMVTSLQVGHIDRSLLTRDLNFYFNPAVLGDFKTSLAPLGPVQTVVTIVDAPDAGMTFRVFHVILPYATLRVSTYVMHNGKLEQFLVSRSTGH